MKRSNFNAFTFGGVSRRERRQGTGIGLSPRLPKGGQRRKLTIGGDSYGK